MTVRAGLVGSWGQGEAWSLTHQLWNQIPGDMGQKADWCAGLGTAPEDVRERLRTVLFGFGARVDLETRVKRPVLERREKRGPVGTWTVETIEDRPGHLHTIPLVSTGSEWPRGVLKLVCRQRQRTASPKSHQHRPWLAPHIATAYWGESVLGCVLLGAPLEGLQTRTGSTWLSTLPSQWTWQAHRVIPRIPVRLGA